MEQMLNFAAVYGWQLALIALLGVILLGVLKYANVFGNIDKGKRKPIYLAISIGFSLTATVIYLLVIGQFEMNYLIAVTMAIYGINQTIYAIYETTNLKDLLAMIFTKVAEKIKDRKDEEIENLTNRD